MNNSFIFKLSFTFLICLPLFCIAQLPTPALKAMNITIHTTIATATKGKGTETTDTINMVVYGKYTVYHCTSVYDLTKRAMRRINKGKYFIMRTAAFVGVTFESLTNKTNWK